ncbi:MAG: hypothetical protein V2I38_00805 [Alcanivoracaceae bacterium]|jgi:hypothetical protein|nr:hypothetical protein [Alcanivoracaceae bacterium]
MATQENRSMVSETYICNKALSRIGGTRITSLDDNGQYAEWCRDNYAVSRDAVLEERMWTFATDRRASTTADLSEWGNQYKHAIPLDWISVFRVFCDQNGSQAKWVREGRFVLADVPTVYMWGIKRVVDTGYFSPMFIEVLAERMAADMAVPLTGDHKKAAYHWQLYQAKLSDAAARDGQQGRNEQIKSNSLIEARGGC